MKFQYVNHAGIEGAGGSAFRELKKNGFNQDDVGLKAMSQRYNHAAALNAAACSYATTSVTAAAISDKLSITRSSIHILTSGCSLWLCEH